MATSTGKKNDTDLIIVFILFLLFASGGGGGNIFGGGSSNDTSTGPVSGDLSSVKVVPDKTVVPGYKRSSFGQAWADVDKNRCDTRNDILKRDLKEIKFSSGSTCKVASGVLEKDPYSGKKIEFVLGNGNLVDIDHIVPLSRAWSMGASSWSDEKRLQYANDPFILVAVGAKPNRAKGDAGPGEWMPEGGSKAETCELRKSYAAKYTAVSLKYGLSISASDKTALANAGKGC